MKQKAYIEITVDTDKDPKKDDNIHFRIVHGEKLDGVENINMGNFPALVIAHFIIEDLTDRFGEKIQPELFEQIGEKTK